MQAAAGPDAARIAALEEQMANLKSMLVAQAPPTTEARGSPTRLPPGHRAKQYLALADAGPPTSFTHGIGPDWRLTSVPENADAPSRPPVHSVRDETAPDEPHPPSGPAVRPRRSWHAVQTASSRRRQWHPSPHRVAPTSWGEKPVTSPRDRSVTSLEKSLGHTVHEAPWRPAVIAPPRAISPPRPSHDGGPVYEPARQRYRAIRLGRLAAGDAVGKACMERVVSLRHASARAVLESDGRGGAMTHQAADQLSVGAGVSVGASSISSVSADVLTPGKEAGGLGLTAGGDGEQGADTSIGVCLRGRYLDLFTRLDAMLDEFTACLRPSQVGTHAHSTRGTCHPERGNCSRAKQPRSSSCTRARSACACLLKCMCVCMCMCLLLT